MKNRPRCGTLEGDIYSFAIILYEIHGRKGPYGDMDTPPQGTVITYNRILIYYFPGKQYKQ